MGSLHFFQALVMLFLAIFIQKIADFIPNITISFLTLNDMGFLVSSSKVLF